MLFVVVIVGCLNVGKFVFVNCIFGCCEVVVEDILGVMCDCVIYKVEWVDCCFLFVDIGGWEFDVCGIDCLVVV